jgi:hypothetical protein
MTPTPPRPASAEGAPAGSGTAVCFGGERRPDNTPPQKHQAPSSDRAVREARLELLREAVHESCGFIRLHAETCQLLIEAGDDAGLIHSLGRLILYTKEAARSGNDLRAVRGVPE